MALVGRFSSGDEAQRWAAYRYYRKISKCKFLCLFLTIFGPNKLHRPWRDPRFDCRFNRQRRDRCNLADKVRDCQEIARRSLALFGVVGLALGAPCRDIIGWLRNEGLWGELSPTELAYVLARLPFLLRGIGSLSGIDETL